MIKFDIAAAKQLAAEALAQYGIAPETSLTLLKQRENVVFRLHADGVDYVVRVHRQGYHSDDELGSELDFVNALRAEGVQVPHFVNANGGRFFCVVGAEGPYGAHQVDLQLFLENQGNFGAETTALDGTAVLAASDFAELGSLLARVHDATEASGFTMRSQRQDWDLAGLTGPSWAWGDPLRLPELAGENRKDVEGAIECTRETLIAYGTDPKRYGPIHADLTPENVLRTSNGLVLIDFDDFARGWHLFDLATALNFYLPHPRYEEYRSAMFGAYEKIRPLNDADHRAYPAIVVARALTYLGWATDRRGEDTAEFLAAKFSGHVVELARNLIMDNPRSIVLGRTERARK